MTGVSNSTDGYYVQKMNKEVILRANSLEEKEYIVSYL